MIRKARAKSKYPVDAPNQPKTKLVMAALPLRQGIEPQSTTNLVAGDSQNPLRTSAATPDARICTSVAQRVCPSIVS